MPFDLFISRAEAIDDLRATGVTPIDAARVHEIMANAPATRKSDTLYWVRHDQGDPWFAA